MAEGDNQKIHPEVLDQIRKLGDFDLTMLLSEIHNHGWPKAQKILFFMKDREHEH